MKKNRTMIYKVIQIVFAFLFLFSLGSNVNAEENESDNETIDGYYIELSEKSEYSIDKRKF